MDRLMRVGFFVSLVTLCFIFGAMAAEFNWAGYSKVLKPAFEALSAVHEQNSTDWRLQGYDVTPHETTGMGTHVPEKAFGGYTLFSSFGNGGAASLIDETGREVHRWQLPFSQVWNEPPHVEKPVGDELIHWTRVKAFPNGDLIANYTSLGDTPSGYGLVKMDRQSKVIWKYAERVHHDFDVDDQGRVYTLLHHFRTQRIPGAPHLKTPALEDFIAVLSPEGEELKRINIYDAFSKSKFSDVLRSMKSESKGDHTHTNTAHLITPEFAAKHDFCKAGDLLISLRNYSTLAIVNIEREEVVWVARGVWLHQHDPDPLPNGNLLIFDNKGGQGPGGTSRVLEWNPVTGAIEWAYQGNEQKTFSSPVRADQQLLANGNVLINESSRGRLFEVTREGEIVWEYFNPVRHSVHKNHVAVVCSAVRYAPEELSFLADSSKPARSESNVANQPSHETSRE